MRRLVIVLPFLLLLGCPGSGFPRSFAECAAPDNAFRYRMSGDSCGAVAHQPSAAFEDCKAAGGGLTQGENVSPGNGGQSCTRDFHR